MFKELLDTPLDSLLTYLNKETSKFEWTPDNIRIEKIQDFLSSISLILNSIQGHSTSLCLKK